MVKFIVQNIHMYSPPNLVKLLTFLVFFIWSCLQGRFSHPFSVKWTCKWNSLLFSTSLNLMKFEKPKVGYHCLDFWSNQNKSKLVLLLQEAPQGYLFIIILCTHLYHSSFQYLSITRNAFIACYIRRKKYLIGNYQK